MLCPPRALAPWVVWSALALPIAGAHAGAPPWGGDWTTSIRAEHPLAGALLDPATANVLDAAAVANRLRGADVVLLGEKHDNPDHHRAQAWILEGLVTAGRRPALVLEMLDSRQGPALAEYLANADATAAGLGAAVHWADSGWPDWTHYQPIAEVALNAGLPVLPGNLPTDTVRRVAGAGAEAVLGAEGLAPRALDVPLPTDLTEALGAEIRRGHCDMLPDAALPGMIAAQRVRDGEMARALLSGRARDDTDSAVLIAGNGHVRSDRAVPWYLAQRAPDVRSVSVGILEIGPDLPATPTPADLRDTEAPVATAPQPFDLIMLTPALDDVDPCEAFRAQLERLRERKDDEPALPSGD
ncbi:ChaN family lipoprotein [Roseospira marina]|nr:ChaN family lipoprotein [Roseospira marina]MBB4312283.1 putative iron-regulated protein [Roseospira marina]MBB5085701.1 putative iron-regulated protein [Roseospira marina]